MIRVRLAGSKALLVVCVLALGACAAVPKEPRVFATPPSGKPPDLFEIEDSQCRTRAEESVDHDSPTDAVVGSALVGSLIGAAAGNAASSRHHDRTGAGALTGLIVGAAVGANRGATVNQASQRRMDRVYIQCMASKGNLVPGMVYRQSAPPASPPGTVTYPPPPPPPR